MPIRQLMAMRTPSPTLLSAALVPPDGKWIWEDCFLLSQLRFLIAGAKTKVIPLLVIVIYLMPPLHCLMKQGVVLNQFPQVMYAMISKSSMTL
jgi:hypothetical protein